MLKLMYKLNRILNKYIYILPVLTLLSKMSYLKDNKMVQSFYQIFKLIIIINIVLGAGLVLYFIDFNSPITSTYSVYSDLMEPYIELVKHLWNKLLSYLNNTINTNTIDSTSQITNKELETVLRDSTSQIKSEVKSGVKEGVKEAVDELLERMPPQDNTYLYKQIAFYSSMLLFGYFFLILPGSDVTPEALTEYNWLNQSLIEVKITVKDLINEYLSKPGNPGTPGTTGTSGVIQATNSVGSEGLSTVTPNTPIIRNVLEVGTQTNLGLLSEGTQTILDGRTVSKMVGSLNIMGDVLDKEVSDLLNKTVDKAIQKITD